MKKLILTTGLILSIGAFAQTADVDQQVAYTRDVISRLTQDLLSRDSAGGLRLTDYRQWEQEYKKLVEENFKKYEANISLRVFGPIKAIVTKMDEVIKTQGLPEDHKKMMLESLQSQLENLKPSLTNEYHQLTQNLLNSNNHIPNGIKWTHERYFNSKNKEVKNFKNSSYEIKSLVFEFFDKEQSSLKAWQLKTVGHHHIIDSAWSAGYHHASYNLSVNVILTGKSLVFNKGLFHNSKV